MGDLLALTTERLTAPVEGVHGAITDRWFRLAGSKAAPLQRVYGGLTASIYGTVRLAGSAIGGLLGVGAEAASRGNGVRPLWSSSFGGGVQAVANAVWGDALEESGSDLRIELGLRDDAGRLVSSDPDSLAKAFPKATGRLVVLLHGLGETERCWQLRGDDAVRAVGLCEALAADGFTPLIVRYNSGRRVSDNGRSLSDLIEEVAGNWPRPVDEIALVGNSMGGLVVRSAVLVGVTDASRWVDLTQHLVTVGAPHLGAPLEKGANLIARGLRFAPESKPVGEFLDQRSAGIQDLRFGAIREEDWQDGDPGALFGNVTDDPLPAHLQQHFVAGVVTEQPAHPIGVLVGDLIVRTRSGTGRGRRRNIDSTNVRVLGKRRHSDLARDPAVHQQVRDWLLTGSEAD